MTFPRKDLDHGAGGDKRGIPEDAGGCVEGSFIWLTKAFHI